MCGRDLHRFSGFWSRALQRVLCQRCKNPAKRTGSPLARLSACDVSECGQKGLCVLCVDLHCHSTKDSISIGCPQRLHSSGPSKILRRLIERLNRWCFYQQLSLFRAKLPIEPLKNRSLSLQELQPLFALISCQSHDYRRSYIYFERFLF